MHYYLADQRADKLDRGSRAVLLDQEGFVSEASTANIVMYREGHGFVSPPLHKILPGVSLSVLAKLASQLEIPVHYRDFRLEDLAGRRNSAVQHFSLRVAGHAAQWPTDTRPRSRGPRIPPTAGGLERPGGTRYCGPGPAILRRR